MTSLCSRSPATGGKHLSQHFAHSMQQLTSSTSDGPLSLHIPTPTPHTPNPILEKGKTGSLPDNDNDSLLVGCCKMKGETKFYDRTAGVLALVHPCGIIVNTVEMFTCESPTQVYLFLIMTFARGQDNQRLRYIRYDHACDLHPFVRNLERKGVFFLAKWLIDKVTFFVDYFHVSKHTEPCCMLPDNPMCTYHPSKKSLSKLYILYICIQV